MAALLISILEEIDAGRDVAPVLDAEDIGQLLPTDVEAANLPRTGARLRQAVDEATVDCSQLNPSSISNSSSSSYASNSSNSSSSHSHRLGVAAASRAPQGRGKCQP